MSAGPPAAAYIDEPALLAQQRSFARLRFNKGLEPGFQLYLHEKMCNRVVLVAFSCISFMLLFVWIDLVFLPEELHRYTVTVRLAVLAVVCVTLRYANRLGKVPPSSAFAAAFTSYVLSGMMVAMIIVISRLSNLAVPVTHDGLYLVLLSGFFLLGLPMRHAVVGSWFIICAYIYAEHIIGSGRSIIIANALFLGCFALIGSLGAYIYEYMMRGAYLNERLLEAARARAERESQSKTRFLATASHDLRQPLHAMSLFIQHLDERVTDPQARMTVKRLSDSSQLLQAMLNSLLDISRLSVGMVRPQLRTFNLFPWLQRVMGSLEVSAEQRGIRMQLVCPKHSAVYSDPLLLERLMRNFLTNALLHSQATEVRVEVTRVEQRVRLAVVDNGCGLDGQEQERIFDEFTQLHNPARTLEKGVGLGLSICRQLMHLLEYPSGLQSAPGQGSRFWIEVPAGDWVEDAEPTAKVQRARLQGRVAIIENDLINQEAMETLLREWGCDVRCYKTVEEALENIAPDELDLLLSDYRLEGEVNGLELVQLLRERDLYSGPVLLITADTSEDVTELARLSDAEIIYKPVLPARLRRAMEQLLPSV
ncbi:MAG: hybrid sensor histidine kinase/response regulator [Pseudomonas sp.]